MRLDLEPADIQAIGLGLQALREKVDAASKRIGDQLQALAAAEAAAVPDVPPDPVPLSD